MYPPRDVYAIEDTVLAACGLIVGAFLGSIAFYCFRVWVEEESEE